MTRLKVQDSDLPELRRRRTKRHIRNRFLRRLSLIVALALLTAGSATIALRYIAPAFSHSAQSAAPDRQQSEASRERVLLTNEETFHPNTTGRPVYPYSVVPGGIEDARELKWVAEHDPVVASHYAGFDYDHARVVRLTLAQTAYVSYRIGNRVYWTRRRVTLKKGEKVITDGKMTARARCANRVEVMPHEATSSLEPSAEKMEAPAFPADGTAIENPPVPFQSALLTHPAMMGADAAPPSSLYNPFVGGNWVALDPPPVPTGLCGPERKKTGISKTGISKSEDGAEAGTLGTRGKKKSGPCESSGTVPEPGTWLLMASGMAAIYWQARRKLARVSN